MNRAKTTSPLALAQQVQNLTGSIVAHLELLKSHLLDFSPKFVANPVGDTEM